MGMAVPKHSDLYRLVLETMSDGEVHHYTDCISLVVQKMRLTDEDCQTLLKLAPFFRHLGS